MSEANKSVDRLVIPRVGDTWDLKRPNRSRMKNFVIGRIYRGYLIRDGKECRGVLIEKKVQPKGRNTTITARTLLKYGKFIHRKIVPKWRR